MDILTWSLVISICALFYCYFNKQLNYFETIGVPYLRGWPIFGSLGDIIFRRKNLFEVVLNMYNLHPRAKYVGAYDFRKPIFILRDQELIKSVTIKNFEHFVNHQSFTDDSVDPLFGNHLANLSDEKWKYRRNVFQPMFNISKLKGMIQLMVDNANNFIDYIVEQNENGITIFKTDNIITMYINDIVADCAFGLSINTFKNPQNDFYVLGKKATSLSRSKTIKFFLARAFPKLMKFIRVRLVDAYTANYFIDVVKNTMSVRKAKGIRRPDMLQLFMDKKQADDEYTDADITDITTFAFSFYFGALDATTTAMCVMAHLLAIHLDVQMELQEEIDDIMKATDGKLTYETINAMHYLDAVFNESTRMYTQCGFLDRVCSKTFVLPPALPGGHPVTLEPGTIVWIPVVGIHTDPKYYDNPEKFDPNRYFRKKVTVNDVNNLGFGIGPRACIGTRFAIVEVKVFFFFLLSKFNLRPNEKTCIPLKLEKGVFSTVAEGGFWLTIEPRN